VELKDRRIKNGEKSIKQKLQLGKQIMERRIKKNYQKEIIKSEKIPKITCE